MKLSAIATLHGSPECIPELVQRLSRECALYAGDDFEIILVDDGCPKASWQIAQELLGQTPNLRVIKLSRNFGQHKAIMTGLALSIGDTVFILDGDLEDQPEWLSLFARDFGQDNVEVVYGFQSSRRGGLVSRVIGEIAWALFQKLTGLRVRRNLVTARLMSRRYVDALLLHREKVTLLAGLWEISGFTQLAVPIEKPSTSESSYSFRSRAALYLEGLLSFSNRPLNMVFYMGFGTLFVGLLVSGWAIGVWLLSGTLEGWASIMSSIWLLSGALMTSLGVVARYLGYVFLEVKQRPTSIVEFDSGPLDGRS